MSQLSLLDWNPPPELMEPLPPETPAQKNREAIAWWKTKLRFYQQAQIKIFNNAHAATLGGAKPTDSIQRMRKHEITRLQGLADEATQKLKELQG
jgi:hypothetical protein